MLFCHEGVKVASLLCLSDGFSVYRFNHTVHVGLQQGDLFDSLSEAVKLTGYFKIHPSVNRNRFLVVL